MTNQVIAVFGQHNSVEDGNPPVKKKRKKAVPLTARTLVECRKRGWIAGVVERRIPFPKPQGTKFDLFGVIDIIAVQPGQLGSLGIQATANIGGHHAKHRDKIIAEPRSKIWVDAGNRLELWSWAKQGARGDRKLWTLRIETYEEMLSTGITGHEKFLLEDWP